MPIACPIGRSTAGTHGHSPDSPRTQRSRPQSNSCQNADLKIAYPTIGPCQVPSASVIVTFKELDITGCTSTD